VDKNEHVYCTNCVHFDDNLKCLNDNSLLTGKCEKCNCKDCDCGDLEDSMTFEFRPNYIRDIRILTTTK